MINIKINDSLHFFHTKSSTSIIYFIFLFFFLTNFFKFYFIFKIYIIVLVFPNIKMNMPQVYLWYILVKSSRISNGASLVAHSKEYACNARVTGDRFNLWIKKIPWRRERLPTPVFWPRESQRVGHDWATYTSLHYGIGH